MNWWKRVNKYYSEP